MNWKEIIRKAFRIMQMPDTPKRLSRIAVVAMWVVVIAYVGFMILVTVMGML